MLPFTWWLFSFIKEKLWRIQNGDWDTDADCMRSGNQGPCEMLETHLVEVKCQGELKLHHPEPLACGRLLMSWYTDTPTLPPPAHWPTRMPPTHQPTRFCPAGLPDHRLPAHWLLPTTGGLHYHQTLAPGLPRRHRQRGLDAKGVTPELLRLKFYFSWTRDLFLFSLSICSSCSLFDCPTSLPVDFFCSPFFSRFSFFLGFVSFAIVS
jgi:hypothetical protein